MAVIRKDPGLNLTSPSSHVQHGDDTGEPFQGCCKDYKIMCLKHFEPYKGSKNAFFMRN